MAGNITQKHHYAPRFYLRNFAVDIEAKKINTLAKHGSRAIWSTRSIKGLGFENDLYIHQVQGVPTSVESTINKGIETPISQSDTWGKISSGQAYALDRSDKPILYALIRHLEARTPHYYETARELAELASSPNSTIPFTDEERKHLAIIRKNPNRAKEMFNHKASSLGWTEKSFIGAGLSIFRSPIPLYTSSVPVLVIRAPAHPSLSLPLPGMIPYQLLLALNPTTMASLVLADFDDAFVNIEIDINVARGFNRHFVGQFARFDHVRHLIMDRTDLSADMTWAPYNLIEETDRRAIFQRCP